MPRAMSWLSVYKYPLFGVLAYTKRRIYPAPAVPCCKLILGIGMIKNIFFHDSWGFASLITFN